jgi:hypothetical protein
MNEAALQIAVKSLSLLLKVNPDEVRATFEQIIKVVNSVDARISQLASDQARILKLLEEQNVGRETRSIIGNSGAIGSDARADRERPAN